MIAVCGLMQIYHVVRFSTRLASRMDAILFAQARLFVSGWEMPGEMSGEIPGGALVRECAVPSHAIFGKGYTLPWSGMRAALDPWRERAGACESASEDSTSAECLAGTRCTAPEARSSCRSHDSCW